MNKEELVNILKVFEIDIENITPVWIGGYDKSMCHDKLSDLCESNIEKTIKGVWRWWARALVAGFLLEKPIRDLELKINKIDVFLSKLFGSNETSSKFIFKSYIREEFKKDISELKTIPRVNLLKRGDIERDKYYYKLHMNISVFNHLPSSPLTSKEIKFLVISLILSLIFDGVGKITSRGFGKFKLISNTFTINTDDEDLLNFSKEVNNLFKEIYSCNNHDRILTLLNKLINLSLKITDEFLTPILGKNTSLPHINNIEQYIEAVNVKKKSMRIEIVGQQPRININKILEKIGHLTLKSCWKDLYACLNKKGKYVLRVSGKKYHTWILGFPRKAEPPIYNCNYIKKEIEKLNLLYRTKRKYSKNKYRCSAPTGYYKLIIKNNQKMISDLRRRSMIRFTIIPSGNSYYIVMYGFLTYELKELTNDKQGRLVHISINKHGYIKITSLFTNSSQIRFINTVFNEAWSKITNLSKQLFSEY